MISSCDLSCVSCPQAVIKKKYGQDATNVGDEGGFAPNIQVWLMVDKSDSRDWCCFRFTCQDLPLHNCVFCSVHDCTRAANSAFGHSIC